MHLAGLLSPNRRNMGGFTAEEELKVGYVFKGKLFPTDFGTPQGGIISAILANMCLDGMQKVLATRFSCNPKTGKHSDRMQSKYRVTFVRYADDFAVTAATPEIAQEAKELLQEFLSERGLELSEEKTFITHIDEGFNILGWNLRKYKGKMIIKPSKESAQGIVSKTRNTIKKEGTFVTQEELVRLLNPLLRGWANYHQHICAKETFSRVDHVVYEQLKRWAKKRHPHKSGYWRYKKYWQGRNEGKISFSSKNQDLARIGYTPIVRHTKVKSATNAYLDRGYLYKHREIGQARKRQAASRLKR